jgi:hypothetical protein
LATGPDLRELSADVQVVEEFERTTGLLLRRGDDAEDEDQQDLLQAAESATFSQRRELKMRGAGDVAHELWHWLLASPRLEDFDPDIHAQALQVCAKKAPISPIKEPNLTHKRDLSTIKSPTSIMKETYITHKRV